jgi:hypothetical protein
MSEIKVDPEFQWALQFRRWGVGRWGYAQASIGNKTRALHRFIWSVAHGCDYASVPMLDHINQDKLDNRIANLRPASESLNKHNRAHRPCVFRRKRDQSEKYECRIGFRGKYIYLGRHNTRAAAESAYLAVKVLLTIVEDALAA